MMELILAAMLMQPPAKVFTLQFNHDGLYTDSYEVGVDGTRSTITPTCTGSGETRLCTSPITLVLNVQHTVLVYAVGTFGEGVSLPFICDVPRVPVNPKVVK